MMSKGEITTANNAYWPGMVFKKPGCLVDV